MSTMAVRHTIAADEVPGPPAPRAAVGPPPATDLACHLHRLWRYLRMHGATAQEAEDLAQEAFIVALQKGALGAASPAIATFLRRTARFLFLRLRKAGRQARSLADAVDALWDRDCRDDGGEAMVAAARECLEQLQGRARQAVELAYGLGAAEANPRTEIAHRLGMQENGVKTLLQRTRQRLRECIRRKTGRSRP